MKFGINQNDVIPTYIYYIDEWIKREENDEKNDEMVDIKMNEKRKWNLSIYHSFISHF